jgi:RND family efflux transporter MFP subunit
MIRTAYLRHCLPFLILTALIPGCGPTDAGGESMRMTGGEGGAESALMRVVPIRPERKTLVRWTEQPGQIEAFEETPIYAKVAGYIEKMHVDIGDPVTGPQFDDSGKIVREGQLLVELSVPELHEELIQKEAAVGQAQAEVRQAAAAVKVARAAETSARAKVEEAGAVLEQTQADYEFAESEFNRLKKLADRGAVTREVAEEKQKLFRAADSARTQTRAKIASARALVLERQSEIEKAQADLEAAEKHQAVAEAELAHTKALLGYTKIRAPYDGIVTARNVHTGWLVQPGLGSGGKPLLNVAQTRVMRIFVDVPELDALIPDGSEAQVRIPSFPSDIHKGVVTRTSWILDAGSRTLRAEIDLKNEEGKLRPGMYASAKVKVAERKDALSVPKTALLAADGKTCCYTIADDGEIKKTPVDPGIRAGDDIEIVSGLSGNEQLIGVNVSAFREGQKVRVEKAAPKK